MCGMCYEVLLKFRGSTAPVRFARFWPCAVGRVSVGPVAGVWPFCVGRVSVGFWPCFGFLCGWQCFGRVLAVHQQRWQGWVLALGCASWGQNLSGGGHSEPQCFNYLFNELL